MTEVQELRDMIRQLLAVIETPEDLSDVERRCLLEDARLLIAEEGAYD